MGYQFHATLPLSQQAGRSLEDAIASAINDGQHKLTPLFENVIDTEDARRTVVDGSAEAEDVWVDSTGSSGSASISFLSNFYAGCKDMNSTDWCSVDVEFEIDGGAIVFDMNLGPKWRIDN